MAARLQDDLRPKDSLPTLESAVYLNLLRAADALLRGTEKLLKPRGLTPSQYNVLRILRGAEPDGLACGEIAARMLTRDPDMTRLLDRLEKRGLVRRARATGDRRVVHTRISPAGLKLLKELDTPVQQMHREQLKHMSRLQLRQLAELLERARASGS